MDADFDQLHVIVPLILALLLVLVAIAGFAVCIKRSKKAFSDLPCGPEMMSRRKLSGDPSDPPPPPFGGSPEKKAKQLVNPAKF